MSDKNRKNSMFSNQDTIVRRAWIESALNSVKSHLNPTQSERDLLPDDFATPEQTVAPQQNAAVSVASGEADRPGLYVAWSAPARRSGT